LAALSTPTGTTHHGRLATTAAAAPARVQPHDLLRGDGNQLAHNRLKRDSGDGRHAADNPALLARFQIPKPRRPVG
jgi:hypothetical protein